MEFEEFVKRMIPGETVVIEYDSKTSPVETFYFMLEHATKRGLEILVDDFVDTLYLYKMHMILSGLDTSTVSNALVIKIGGIQNVGRIVEKIPLSPGPPLKERYKKAYEKVKQSNKVFLNPCLGLDKFFIINGSKMDILSEIADISLYVGDTSRIAVYFLDTGILGEASLNPLPFMESLATTLIELKKDENAYQMLVKKSVNQELEGEEIQL